MFLETVVGNDTWNVELLIEIIWKRDVALVDTRVRLRCSGEKILLVKDLLLFRLPGFRSLVGMRIWMYMLGAKRKPEWV